MASIFGRAKRIRDKFLEVNFEMWRDFPIQYLSVLCLVPAAYIFVKDADGRYMEAEKLAGPPV